MLSYDLITAVLSVIRKTEQIEHSQGRNRETIMSGDAKWHAAVFFPASLRGSRGIKKVVNVREKNCSSEIAS